RQCHAFRWDELQRRSHVDECLQTEPGDQANTGQRDEKVLLPQQPKQTTHHDEYKDADDDQTDDHAEFLPGDGKDEIRMRIRKHVLHASLAWAAPEETAIAEGLERGARLVIAADAVAGMQKILHPLLHVR